MGYLLFNNGVYGATHATARFLQFRASFIWLGWVGVSALLALKVFEGELIITQISEIRRS